MKRVLILILLMTTLGVAHDKKAKVKPGPYVFTSKASAQTVKELIVQLNLKDGYVLDSDHELQLRFSRPAQMPLYGALFMASSACPGMATKQVWSYTMAELNGSTKVTVQPAWEYPDDYCQKQTHDVPWSQPEEIVAFQAMLDKAPAVAPTSNPTHAAAPPTAALVSAPSVAANHPAQDQENASSEPSTQATGPADAARLARQHQACLDLAKDNPTISCK